MKPKAIKVSVVATKTMWVTQEILDEDKAMCLELNEDAAIQCARAILVDEMWNDPNRGSAKILEIKY